MIVKAPGNIHRKTKNHPHPQSDGTIQSKDDPPLTTGHNDPTSAPAETL